MIENKYISEWKKHVLNAADALKEGDKDKYEEEISMMNEAYEAYKKDEELSYLNETSFGVAREIFEGTMPELFVNDKKTLSKILKTIREDKNLSAQFMFLEALKNYKTSYNSEKYLTETYNLVKNTIDPATIKKSNRKLFSLLHENSIKAKDYISEEKMNFYNDCDKILTEKHTLANVSEMNEAYDRVNSYMIAKAKEKENEPVLKTPTIKEFTEKYNTIMTENEKEILNTLLENNENKQRKLFEDYKKECLKKVKHMIMESDGEDKERLNTLYKTLSVKFYNKEKIFEDIIKMLEISNIFEE